MLIKLGEYNADFRPWKSSLGRVFQCRFALDVETTPIVAHETPDYVLAAATDGAAGYFLTPAAAADFLAVHWGLEVVLHHAAFDLAVLAKLLKRLGVPLDVYRLVDERRVWDTMILHKLHGLATLGHTHQGKGRSTLERCASLHLGVELPKDARDAAGNEVRTSWGQWLHRPPGDIPPAYLEYLGLDALATWGVFARLEGPTYDAVHAAADAFGYVGHDWLTGMIQRYGVQTHDLQLMASVALDQTERAGIGLDLDNRDEIVARVKEMLGRLREELRVFGYMPGEPGCDKVLQAIIRRTLSKFPQVHVPLTGTGKFSTKAEDLEELAEIDEFFCALKDYKQVSTLLNTFLEKMSEARLHPHYDLLKNTGRTSASSPNVQNVPRQRKRKKPRATDAFDLRRCFVPAPGKLFYVADYSGVELCSLGQALRTQFGLDSVLARKINEGVDLHRFVAARMKLTGRADAGAILADPARYAEFMASLSDEDRGAAKPANFGLPAGMGKTCLCGYARVQYEQPYTEEDAAGWKQAWLDSFPEMADFLAESGDQVPLALARELSLTPAEYAAATGRPNRSYQGEQDLPAAWLGWMALKVLKEEAPATRAGREYTPEELDFFWSRLGRLADRLDPRRGEDLRQRRPGVHLGLAVKQLLDRRGVFTITGRLRVKASYSARRNTVFQGAASDGAKLALYRLWRAGHAVVAFIHDEVVVEVDAGADLAAARAEIDGILVGSMREVCPDVLIKVEGAFRRRWGKDRQDAVEPPKSAPAGGAAGAGDSPGTR
jgi:DNA polymerase I-like protein with 3'-5' exonuclease and polymerase domains